MNAAQKSRSQRSPKDEAINKIALGALLKLGPTGALGLALEASQGSFQDSLWFGLLGLIVLVLFIQGYIFFVRGTLEYAQSKGYRAVWGWWGLLSILWLPILLCLPSKGESSKQQPQSNEKDPFSQLNLVELALLPWVGILALYLLIVCVIAGFSSLTVDQVFEILEDSSSWPMSGLSFGFEVAFCLYVTQRVWQSRIASKTMLGRLQAVQLKQVLCLTFVDLLFALSAARLTLYGISFFAPGYVVDRMEREYFTDVPTFILWSVSVIVIAPLLEEFLFRGLIIHKLGLKWGLVPAYLVSSLLFAIVHFRFDLATLFITGLLFAFLYLKSGSLWPSICCHAVYNFCIVGLNLTDRLSFNATFDSADEMIQSYQQWVQSQFWILIPMLCASGLYLGYFLWSIWPNANAELPYFANESRSRDELVPD